MEVKIISLTEKSPVCVPGALFCVIELIAARLETKSQFVCQEIVVVDSGC